MLVQSNLAEILLFVMVVDLVAVVVVVVVVVVPSFHWYDDAIRPHYARPEKSS